MSNFQRGNDLLVRWAVVKPDGKPFPLTDFSLEVSYSAGRARDVVLSSEILSVEDNAVCWTIPGNRLSFVGPYSTRMKLYKDKQLCSTLSVGDAFNIVSGNRERGLTLNLLSVIDLK